MVQVLVHIRAAGGVVIAPPRYELFECDLGTTVLQIKEKVKLAGEANKTYALPLEQQELVFLGERCCDSSTLRDYGVSEPWIVQVAGFIVNPAKPGQQLVRGQLQPIEAM